MAQDIRSVLTGVIDADGLWPRYHRDVISESWKFATSRRRDLILTLALLVVGSAGPLAYALGQPAYSTGDEMAHVDYAYQIWTGRLPEFFEGLMLQTDVGYRPDLQWVSQHPPLFYALLAPVVGPLVSAGHPVVAVMMARGFLIVMAALSVLAVRWMVRGAFPGRADIASAAALIFALSSWFPRQGGSVYNDLPAVLAGTVAMGFLFRAVRAPDSRRLVVGFALALAAASLVRFSMLPIAAGLISALVVHRVVVIRQHRQALTEAAGTVVAIAVASGWWWIRQRSITGNFAGSQADFWINERGWSPLGFREVVTSDFWLQMLQQFFSTYFMRPSEPWVIPAVLGIVALLLAPAGLGLSALIVDRWRGRAGDTGGADVIVLLTLMGVIGVVVGTQIGYSMSSGSALPRYFFAFTPSIAAVMAYGFFRWRWAALAFLVWVAVRLVGVALEVNSTLNRPLRAVEADLYPFLSWLACAAVVFGAMVAVVMLVRGRTQQVQAPARESVHV